MLTIRALLLATALAWPPAGESTTIIFYVDKDQLIVGSDGFKINNDRANEAGAKFQLFNSNSVFAASGLLQSDTHDVFSIAKMAFGLTNYPTDAIESYCSNALSRVFNGPQSNDVKTMSPVLHLGIAYWNKGSPEFYILRFDAKWDESPVGVKVDRQHIVYKPEIGRGVQCIGWMDATNWARVSDLNFWENHQKKERVATLIEWETKRAWRWVDYPICLVTFDKSGVSQDTLSTPADLMKMRLGQIDK